jgi:5'-nucleotidase
MHILVTNDDGVTAPGLLALVQAMRSLGDVTVLAPDRNWSASGHVKTLHRPLRAKPVLLADGSPALASDGAPSDCVALALMGLVAEPVDLVVSGINPYANLGHDLTYSGTVTAAMEAAIYGVKALAFSLNSNDETPQPLDYGPTAQFARIIAEQVLQNGLPNGTLLNVNVPVASFEQIHGIRITRQGTRIYRDQLVRRADPRGRPYYWIGGDAPTGLSEPGTDFGALAENYISITPIELDLTAYDALATLEKWNWSAGA